MTEQHQPTNLTPEEQDIEKAIHELANELTVSIAETVRDKVLARGVKVAAPALSIAMGRALASVICTVVDDKARLALLEIHTVALSNSVSKFDTIMAEAEEAIRA